jgi:hypothetical protein
MLSEMECVQDVLAQVKGCATVPDIEQIVAAPIKLVAERANMVFGLRTVHVKGKRISGCHHLATRGTVSRWTLDCRCRTPHRAVDLLLRGLRRWCLENAGRGRILA